MKEDINMDDFYSTPVKLRFDLTEKNYNNLIPPVKRVITYNYEYIISEQEQEQLKKYILDHNWNPDRETIMDGDDEIYVEISSYNINDVETLMNGYYTCIIPTYENDVKWIYMIMANSPLNDERKMKIRKFILDHRWNSDRGTIKNNNDIEMKVEVSILDITDINYIMKDGNDNE